MKTFQFLLFISILFAANKANTQTYHPLPTQNAYWSVYEFDELTGGYDDKVYSVEGDTLLNGLQYTKIYKLNDYPTIYDTVRTLHCFMRQDNDAKKIWFIRNYLDETTEKLGYDLSASVGDTVSLPAFDFTNNGDSLFNLRVKDPSFAKIIDGSYRNYYSFSSIFNNAHKILYIEGISSIDNTFPNKYFSWDPFYQSNTRCMHENNAYTWPANSTPLDTTHCGFNLVNSKYFDEIALKIFPNPTNNYISIYIPANFVNGTVELTDLMGKQLKKLSFFNNSSQILINISDFPSGVYFLVTRTLSSIRYNKLIIQH